MRPASYDFRKRLTILSGIGLLITAIAGTGFGAVRAVDFMHVVGGLPTAFGDSIGTDAAGYIYAVGCTDSPGTFPSSAGALRAKSSRWPMVFLQKLTPDGSKAVVSALLGESRSCNTYLSRPSVAAKVDASGNVYVVFCRSGNVVGPSIWPENQEDAALLKISPGGDRVLYAVEAFSYCEGPVTLDLGPDGSVYAATSDSAKLRLARIDPSGSLSSDVYDITDTIGPDGRNPYDGSWLAIAVGPDRSIYVAGSPYFMYRVDLTGKKLLYRVQLDARQKSIAGIGVDGAGNAYAAGSASFGTGLPPGVTPIGFTQSIPGAPYGIVIKVASSGSLVYTDAFDTAQLTAIAVDTRGNVWAGGNSAVAFTILELNSAGTNLLHYISLPSQSSLLSHYGNIISGLALDPTGRLLAAGSTVSVSLPDAGALRDGSTNAFALRINQAAPQANLQVAATTKASGICAVCNATYVVQVTNLGPDAATDVTLNATYSFLDTADISHRQQADLKSCRTSTSAACDPIIFASLAPGETQYVSLELSISGAISDPFVFFALGSTSADDPDQLNNYSVVSSPLRAPYYYPFGIPSGFVIEIDGSRYTAGTALNIGPSSLPNDSDVEIYVPSPQATQGTLYEFVRWNDGGVENPRMFHIGSSLPDVSVVLRKVTEPWVSPDAPVVHAGNYHTGAVAPGEVISLFGYNLGPARLQPAALDTSGRLLTDLAGLQVIFDGTPAPVVFASANDSSVIVPYSVAGKSTTEMTIRYSGQRSSTYVLPVTDAVPGLFTLNAQGNGPLTAFNSDGSRNALENPALHGSVIVFYGSGEGVTTPASADGEIANSPAPQPLGAVSVTIGGQPAEVIYAGGVPGVTAGVLQVNARVPTTVKPGLLPVILQIGDRFSQREATIAVR